MPEVNAQKTDPTLLTTQALLSEIAHLKELQNKEFFHVQQRFSERDEQVKETAAGIRREVGTAFESANKAVAKSEENNKELVNALGRELHDVKERVVRIESRGEGGGAAIHWIISGVMFLIALSSAVIAFMSKAGH